MMLFERGDNAGAQAHAQEALRIRPQFADAHFLMGVLAMRAGKAEEALACLKTAASLTPNGTWAAHQAQAVAFTYLGRIDDAIASCRGAVRAAPDNPETLFLLGRLLLQRGDTTEALTQWREALRLKPDRLDLLNSLAWVLATSPDPMARNGADAVRYGERACELTGYRQAMLVGTLAAAYAEAGRFPEAVTTAEKARTLAQAAGDEKLAARNTELLELYRAGRAYHEEAARR